MFNSQTAIATVRCVSCVLVVFALECDFASLSVSVAADAQCADAVACALCSSRRLQLPRVPVAAWTASIPVMCGPWSVHLQLDDAQFFVVTGAPAIFHAVLLTAVLSLTCLR